MRDSEFWQLCYLIYIFRGIDAGSAAQMADDACVEYDERFQKEYVEDFNSED